MKSVELFIKGKNVHNIDYRPFLLLKASEQGIQEIWAFNSKLEEAEMVVVRLQGEDEIVVKYIDFLKTNYPDQLEVEGIIEREFNGHVAYASDFA
jgi:acylphosphatase